ncbi:MAG: hypothetical protein V4710_01875 [Verrucomicrobiota bacterium]
MKTMHLLFMAICAARPLFAEPAAAVAPYVAHEWGTFTSVQGTDGIQMDWNPLNIWDLPNFVYTLNRPGLNRRPGVLIAGKSAIRSRQRMETPVIYFYSEKPRKIDVGVDLPEGSITEWYPQAIFPNEFNPLIVKKPFGPPKGLRWPRLTIEASAAEKPAPLPNDGAGSHYYAARETDASLISIATRDGAQESEKFLFYRGVASFVAPLTVSTDGDHAQTVHLKNTGKETLQSLFLYRAREGRGTVLSIANLAANETRTISFPSDESDQPLGPLREVLGRQLQSALTAAGLYPKESAAMVHTWQESWLGESGIRVLYILPREWTDRTLPLTLSPAPREIARVMVGRAEIITPSMERALNEEVERFSTEDPDLRAQAVANTRNLDLGRFAESAMRRVMKNRTPVFSARSWELLQATGKKPPLLP